MKNKATLEFYIDDDLKIEEDILIDYIDSALAGANIYMIKNSCSIEVYNEN